MRKTVIFGLLCLLSALAGLSLIDYVIPGHLMAQAPAPIYLTIRTTDGVEYEFPIKALSASFGTENRIVVAINSTSADVENMVGSQCPQPPPWIVSGTTFAMDATQIQTVWVKGCTVKANALSGLFEVTYNGVTYRVTTLTKSLKALEGEVQIKCLKSGRIMFTF